MSKAFKLADGWPHKHLTENPEEINVSPRTAYFVRDGEVMALRLEELDDTKIVEANEALEAEGVTYHLIDEE